MTFKEFAYKSALLPATIFSGLTNLLLGSNPKNNNNEYIYNDDTKKYKKTNGLFGWVANAFKAVARSFANFIANHKDAIAIAFWASLIVGGAAALTVAFWPAALTAVATFSIMGYSIAGIVGTGFAAQVAAIGGLAAVATSAVTYTVAAVVNTITGIVNLFSGRNKVSSNPDTTPSASSNDERVTSSAQSLRQLGGRKQDNSCIVEQFHEEAPTHTSSIIASQSFEANADDYVVNAPSSSSMSL